MELYNRGGFTKGYYTTYNGKQMMSSKRPNHSGVLVGKVVSIKGNRASIQLCEEIKGQDILEFRDKKGEAQYEYTVKDLVKKNQTCETNFKPGSKIQIGDMVYRTKNNALLDQLSEEFINKEDKIMVNGDFVACVGQPMKYTLISQGITTTVQGDVVEKAQKQPMQEDKIKEQLSKTNTTSFKMDQLEVHMESDIFIPVSKLNELRREAIEQLTGQIVKQYQRKLPIKNEETNVTKIVLSSEQNTGISVSVGNLSQLRVAITIPEIDQIYLRTESVNFNQMMTAAIEVFDSNKAFYLVMPYIFRENTYQMFEHALIEKELDINSKYISGFVIKNLEEYEFVKKYSNEKEASKEIILDYNLHTINKEAKTFWKNQGVYHFTASIELNDQELRELGCQDSDLIVYGHIPLMTSTQCVVKNTIGCVNKEGIYTLQDRLKKKFYVVNNCKYCYNTIYNGSVLSLLNNKREINQLNPKQVRLDFTLETSEEMLKIAKTYIDVFRYNKEADKEFIKDYTKGHFKRGIE